jgi:hypothetical protein
MFSKYAWRGGRNWSQERSCITISFLLVEEVKVMLQLFCCYWYMKWISYVSIYACELLYLYLLYLYVIYLKSRLQAISPGFSQFWMNTKQDQAWRLSGLYICQ